MRPLLPDSASCSPLFSGLLFASSAPAPFPQQFQ
jgi:hypothetical protein